MVFPNVELENSRVLVAEKMGLKLDPRNKSDLAVVVLVSTIYSIDLISAVFVILFRKYPPLRSKCPLTMVAMFTASIFWLIGDLQTNGHVTLRGSTLTDCRVWSLWSQVVLGVFCSTTLLAVRSYIFYRVFTQNLPAKGLQFLLPLIVYFSCLFIIGVVFTAVGPSRSAEYVPALDLCSLTHALKVTTFVVLWITDVFTCLITWKTRNIKSSFREVWEMCVTCLIVFIALITNTIIRFKHPLYPLNRHFRIALTLVDAACINVLWWWIMAKPLYCRIFRRAEYLQEWTDKLCRDGMQREYQVAANPGDYQKQETESLQASEPPYNPHYDADAQYSSSRVSFRYN
ncbi:hypothetical protein GGI11_004284 [Coemansia sp. RSA 2049]|nr:hypothetical protein H4217_006147 [Coemansia sp. RSA 1939]KAJ2513823.1 hypothetical protein GGI11_004284 [Coemansia sp. RSA 2049]KAJ2606226.1 hypothetical protein EV177_005969 [Coemansia sp. RSA 1804]KAJ2685111.1 hypothetical protein GGH99_003850 [Coemansia sp. RSA 1285]